MVHRDIKPENVLIDAEGEPLVTDFGLAARAGEWIDGGSGEGTDNALKTQAGKVLGTPAYMSPEQADGKSGEAGSAADQYSLGVMLFEMVTGRLPFEGPVEVVLFHHIETLPPRPRSLIPRLSRDLEGVILRCLAKEPGKRYSSCEELAEDLRRWQSGEPVRARPLTWAERAAKWAFRNPAVAALLVVVAVVTAVGAGIGLWQYGQVLDERNRAVNAELDERTRAGELVVALQDKTKAEEDAKKRATDLAAELKEKNRLLDLNKLRDARTAWKNKEVGVALDLLADVAPENRCIAWGVLRRIFDPSLLTLYGHTEDVRSVAVSADGTRVVTGSDDKTARVWDARTGQTLAELKGHADAVFSVAVSADGSRVVTGSSDKTARVWDARTGHTLVELKGHTGSVESVAVSRGRLASGNRVV